MSAAETGPVVHGGERTPPTRTEDANAALEAAEDDYSDERHQLAMAIHDGGCQCRGHTLGWTIRHRDSLQLADAVLAAGYVRAEQPELITMPTFNGCTDTNPDYCACNDGAVCCDACGDEIEDGSEVWALTRPLYPWAAAEGDGQEFENLLWHTNCDLRGSVSGGGNATGGSVS